MSEEAQPVTKGSGRAGYGTSGHSSDQAFSALAHVNCIKIKEEVSLIEAATAIIGQEMEMANRYKIKNDETDEELFYAVEQTDWCGRQLKQCMPDCAAWNLDIFLTGKDGMTKVIQMQRDFTYTCLCYNRPVVNILDAESQELLGAVTDPWTCCDLKFTVRDQDDSDIVSANGGCCQWGLCCPLPCGPCAKVEFGLANPDGGEIGTMTKKVPGIMKFFLAPDVDNYKVKFSEPEAWTPKTKALMIALAIYMDFRFFSENPNDDNGGLLGNLK